MRFKRKRKIQAVIGFTCITRHAYCHFRSRGESFTPAWPHTFVEIDHELMSTVTLLLPLIQEGLFAVFCARLFICALWSPAGKGLTSWLSFVVSSVSLSLSHWYPGSGVVLDCIDS